MAETKVIVIPYGNIYNYIDGKFRNDIPEEDVRQTMVNSNLALHLGNNYDWILLLDKGINI